MYERSGGLKYREVEVGQKTVLFDAVAGHQSGDIGYVDPPRVVKALGYSAAASRANCRFSALTCAR